MVSGSALEGVTVFDFSQGLAGSVCTLQLADAGADVINIESLLGDPIRQLGPKRAGRSALFDALSRDKRSVAVAYEERELGSALGRMVRGADVIVEDFERGEAAPNGFAYEDLSRSNEGLVYCSLSSLSESGLDSGLPVSELELQGLTGHMAFLGQLGKPPVRSGADIAAVAGGMHAFVGIIAALLWRAASGRGQKVDVSSAGSLLSLGSHWMADFSDPDAYTGGVTHPYETPETGYRCKDRPVMFGFFGRRVDKRDPWKELCKALGLEDLLKDPWIAKHGAGWVGVGRDAQEMKPLLEEAMSDWNSDDFLEMIHEIGGRGAPFMSYEELYGDPLHPEAEASGAIIDVTAPDGRRYRAVRSPWAADEAIGRKSHLPAPELGEHTDDVLKSAGVPDEEIRSLRSSGLIK